MENYISFYDRQANVERKARSFCIGCKVECGSLFFFKEMFLALFETCISVGTTYFNLNILFHSFCIHTPI